MYKKRAFILLKKTLYTKKEKEYSNVCKRNDEFDNTGET